jgi:hypothetical protein
MSENTASSPRDFSLGDVKGGSARDGSRVGAPWNTRPQKESSKRWLDQQLNSSLGEQSVGLVLQKNYFHLLSRKTASLLNYKISI